MFINAAQFKFEIKKKISRKKWHCWSKANKYVVIIEWMNNQHSNIWKMKILFQTFYFKISGDSRSRVNSIEWRHCIGFLGSKTKEYQTKRRSFVVFGKRWYVNVESFDWKLIVVWFTFYHLIHVLGYRKIFISLSLFVFLKTVIFKNKHEWTHFFLLQFLNNRLPTTIHFNNNKSTKENFIQGNWEFTHFCLEK